MIWHHHKSTPKPKRLTFTSDVRRFPSPFIENRGGWMNFPKENVHWNPKHQKHSQTQDTWSIELYVSRESQLDFAFVQCRSQCSTCRLSQDVRSLFTCYVTSYSLNTITSFISSLPLRVQIDEKRVCVTAAAPWGFCRSKKLFHKIQNSGALHLTLGPRAELEERSTSFAYICPNGFSIRMRNSSA